MSDHDNAPSLPDRRRGGRPRVSAEGTTSVSTTLPLSEYDRLLQIAKTRRTTLAAALRDLLRIRVQ